MKRVEDLKEFLKARKSIAESIDFLPDTPDGLGVEYLEKVDKDVPIAENPYEPSEIRENGLKIWDSVYITIPKSVSSIIKRPKDLSVLRSTNKEWENTKEALGMVGRPDGVHYLRPKGKYILDMMNDDIRMLQGAHIIAHRTPVSLAIDDYTFGQTSDIFLRSLIKLFIARKFGLLINVHPEKDNVDSFSLYGIEVFGSTDLRSPSLIAASGRTSRLKPDETVIMVLGSVGIEAHPRQIAKGGMWREINKWSCIPTLVSLAGWECVDYVTHTERTELAGELCYAAPCSDLRPMCEFEEMVELAKSVKGMPEKTENVTTVDEWLGSCDFELGLSVTPQLPCPHCIRINEKAEGVVKRPKTRKPKCSFKEAQESSYNDIKEWADYVTFMQNCISIGRDATTYALKSVTSVKKRNTAFNKRSAIMKRISSLKTRYAKKMSNGFISDAESIDAEIEKLKKELEL